MAPRKETSVNSKKKKERNRARWLKTGWLKEG